MASKAAQSGAISWTRNRGRNGWDIPSSLPPEMTAESFNVDLVQNALGRRRNGSVVQSFTPVFTAAMLARFQAGQSDAAAELHAIGRKTSTVEAYFVRVTAGGAAVVQSATDAIESAFAQKATWAVLNGKLYWAFRSGVNRLHVYDPAHPSLQDVRRAGLGAPQVSPSVGNGIAGPPNVAATVRYYRTRSQVRLADGTLQRESEAGPIATFTPSGTAQDVIVQRGPETGEGETHWVVEGSADNATWFQLSDPIPWATLTYADALAPTSYGTRPAAPLAGTRATFPSVKFLCADADRLLGFGVWESAPDAAGPVPPRPGRVYLTPVLDSTDQDDDERLSYGVDAPGYIDVGRNRGYEDRALAGPIDGQFFAFQSLGVHMLVPTGEVLQPFRRITLSWRLGAVSHWSTFIGEDEAGTPCLYFLDPKRGAYRYGARGLEYIGYDVQDLWETVNLDATEQVAHGYFDFNLKAAVWFVATGTANAPNRCLVFFTKEAASTPAEGARYGWSQWGASKWFDANWSSLFFSRTIGSSASGAETGFIACAGGVYRLNMPGATDDDGDPFQAYVRSPVFQTAKYLERTAGVAYLQASAHRTPPIVLQQTLTPDFGRRPSQVKLVSLAPEARETRVIRKVPDLAVARATSLQVELGDVQPLSVPAWTIDDWTLTIEPAGEK